MFSYAFVFVPKISEPIHGSCTMAAFQRKNHTAATKAKMVFAMSQIQMSRLLQKFLAGLMLQVAIQAL